MAFTTYKEIRPWARAIQAAVQNRTMPPWHADPHYGKFLNDARLKNSEVEAIVAWAKNGAPEGNSKDLPALPKFADGWQIGKPDAIYSIEEYTLGSNGEAEEQTFFVETNLKEDVWAESIEIRAGNRRVVHHAQVWLDQPVTGVFVSPGAPVIDDGCKHPGGGMWPGSILASFVPGQVAEVWPAGIARRIPAGSRLKFIIHYAKATGKEEKDRTSIGLRFAKHAPTQELHSVNLRNTTFLIPANAEQHVVTACYVLNEDADVMSYLAHMRYRGRSMRFEANYPDGRSEILIDIPQYDFEWQTKYRNAVPVRLPKGTRIRLTATFDNSPNNRNNPDPSKTVRWGDKTADEMMDGWLEFVTPKH